jgi:IS5 family transposase
MTQMSFSDAEYAGKRKQTRRETFLAEMETGGAVGCAAGAD